MTGFEWFSAWNESIEFGLAAVLVLLAAECLVLAWRIYSRTRLVLIEDGFSVPSSKLRGGPDVPRSSCLLAAVGAVSLITAMVLLTYSFV